MSVSKKRKVTENPCVRFYEFKGGEKKNGFYWYDKNSDKEDKNVFIDKLDVIIIDGDTFEITGYNQPKNLGIYSNTVAGTNEEMKVKYSNGELIAQGPWKTIKDTVKGAGGKYTKVLYALERGSGELVCIKLSGSALNSFINKLKSSRAYDSGAGWQLYWKEKDIKMEESGSVTYASPVFKMANRDPETIKDEKTKEKAKTAWDLLVKLDEETVQPFISYKLTGEPSVSENDKTPVESEIEEVPAEVKETHTEDKMPEDVQDELPF